MMMLFNCCIQYASKFENTAVAPGLEKVSYGAIHHFSVTADEVQNSSRRQPLLLQAFLLNSVSPGLYRLCSHHTRGEFPEGSVVRTLRPGWGTKIP